MRESAVEMSQIKVNEVVGKEDVLNESDRADFPGWKVMVVPSLRLLTVVSRRGREYPARV